jgi:hypothetical protein
LLEAISQSDSGATRRGRRLSFRGHLHHPRLYFDFGQFNDELDPATGTESHQVNAL